MDAVEVEENAVLVLEDSGHALLQIPRIRTMNRARTYRLSGTKPNGNQGRKGGVVSKRLIRPAALSGHEVDHQPYLGAAKPATIAAPNSQPIQPM